MTFIHRHSFIKKFILKKTFLKAYISSKHLKWTHRWPTLPRSLCSALLCLSYLISFQISILNCTYAVDKHAAVKIAIIEGMFPNRYSRIYRGAHKQQISVVISREILNLFLNAKICIFKNIAFSLYVFRIGLCF